MKWKSEIMKTYTGLS